MDGLHPLSLFKSQMQLTRTREPMRKMCQTGYALHLYAKQPIADSRNQPRHLPLLISCPPRRKHPGRVSTALHNTLETPLQDYEGDFQTEDLDLIPRFEDWELVYNIYKVRDWLSASK
ncbi:hypothetical protein BCR33DRAFT_326119 [Rhizoclosmatium globosum]|uniref:Uncharacterized protein n=1 Tax=Rhizoclosmatium globosum TaxID=329046 RepID=A0A1Y2C4M7_9FUNG|nr:hypothetical protein BCR33DRAFT_326119 [Rhizoclosmatium globosum]|eukprot:ORY41844.1 hypothetical protein BCR33DRAFT_326119 [Rhizoclosmatium globosum]